jgi:hypothetical protein
LVLRRPDGCGESRAAPVDWPLRRRVMFRLGINRC